MPSKKRDLEADLKKLADAFFDNIELDRDCEFGSIGLDGKRPFGNSYVEADILEIIGWKSDAKDEDGHSTYSWRQKEYARELYYTHLIPFLKQQWKRTNRP